jgi:endonuclease/exonuclease/phosphatase family metal-dependent hydrolase
MSRGEEVMSGVGFARNAFRLMLAGVLGTWLGVQAIRSTLHLVVWNVAEDAPANVIGAVAGAIWIIGALGWLPVRLLGMNRAGSIFALLLAIAIVLRSLIAHGGITPYISFAALIAWAWWMPCWLRSVSADARIAPAAIIVGLIVQQAAQTALHGLDLHVLIGWGPAAVALVLAVAFLWAARAQPLVQTLEPRGSQIAWGAFALGPFLFLELTLLANPGRIAVASSYELPLATLLSQAGLITGLLSFGLIKSRWSRAAVGVLTVALLAVFDRAGAALPLVLLLVQLGVAMLLLWSFEPAKFFGARRIHLLFAVGQIVFFVILFLFYSRVDWSAVWLIGAALLSLASLIPPALPFILPVRVSIAGVGAVILGLVIALIPAGSSIATLPEREFRVFQYNIHQGLDAFSVPAIREIAEAIERSGADIVALQEVNRGMTISGGVDHLAWLAWRLPQYRVVFGQMHGQLYGNAILSRYPVTASGYERYARGLSGLPRAFTWAVLDVGGKELLVITTHLTPYDSGAEVAERADQAAHLLRFIGTRTRVMLTGDLNDDLGSPALTWLTSGGLRDAAASLGQAGFLTHPATKPRRRFDYIMLGADLRALAHEVPQTLASDHLPLSARVAVER